MGRPLLPPGGFAQVSVRVIFELDLPPVIRDTYTALRVLAWGAPETPELSWGQIAQYTGKKRSTVYWHIRTSPPERISSWRRAKLSGTRLFSTNRAFVPQISQTNGVGVKAR